VVQLSLGWAWFLSICASIERSHRSLKKWEIESVHQSYASMTKFIL